ncbi:MAG: hypothetical protein LBM70_09195 [Victivallales bacterium]|jgi:general secretion pathway protein D|nr:hypothetical protein [Victivallales bacterium]
MKTFYRSMIRQRLTVGATLCVAVLLNSCALFRPDEDDKDKKSRFEFLRSEQKEHMPERVESSDEEQVKPETITESESTRKKFEELNSSGKPVKSAPTPIKEAPRFYDDFILMNGDEEISVQLVFNSAPLLDVLPAFADVLGFNFVADNDMKGSVTLNLNSKMTRKELWNTFDRMLYLSGAGVTVEDSLLKIMALPKLAQQPNTRVGGEVFYYPLKNSTAKDVVAQVKPFLGRDSVCVELARPNAILICDDPANIEKLRQILTVIDQSARANWPRLAIPCYNILPTKLVEELQNVLPVLGFTVTKTTDKTELPGAIQLVGIDRLAMIVISGATQEAIDEIRKWVDIFDSADSLDQERVFVYKVGHNRADQLAKALSVIYNTQGETQTIDPTTGTRRTESLNSTQSTQRTTTTASNSRTGSAAVNSTQTDQNSSLFETPVRVFADGVLNRLVIRTTPRTYASIKALLDRLDVVPAQVLFQVLVVEVTLTESTKFGLEFSAMGSGSGIDSLLGTNYENLTPFGATKQDGFTFLLNDPNNPENKFGYIRALAGNNTIKVISSPQLLVSSHTEAHIQVGSAIPIITGGITNSSSEANLTQTYTYEDVGIILTLTPQITSTNLISMEVKQVLSAAIKNTTSTKIDSPEITKREIETSMTIAHGRTMVIGGLIQEKHNDDLQSVPIVNDIPFLRRLFGNTEAKIERSEILVLITGYIVNERSQVEELIKRYNEALITLNDFDKTLGDKAKPHKGANKLDHSEFWR